MCKRRCSKFTTMRWLPLLMLLGALLVSPSSQALAAETCQASGSIPTFPQGGASCAAGILGGGTLDAIITFTNTASTTTTFTPVSAVLKGTITVTLAAGDSFVSVGATGCVANNAGVATCT